MQITEKGANNGGLWIDFPDVKPRDLRLGVFPAASADQPMIAESDPQAPLVVVKNIGYLASDWHHVAFTWQNLDSGQPNAKAILYLDGKPAGELANRKLAMLWNLEKTGIYVAISYIGLLDELALFDRALNAEEIAQLHTEPGLLAPLKQK